MKITANNTTANNRINTHINNTTTSTNISNLVTSKTPPRPDLHLLPKRPLKRTTIYKTTPPIGRKTKPRGGGPPTPLLRWNFHHLQPSKDESGADVEVGAEEDKKKKKKGRRERVSARKLGAALWRFQAASAAAEEDESGGERRRKGRESREKEEEKEEGRGGLVLYKPGIAHDGERLSCLHGNRQCGSEAKDPLRSPCSVNGPVNGYFSEKSPFQIASYAMEGATKWDPVSLNVSNENGNGLKTPDQKKNGAKVISALEAELEQSRVRVEELEAERRSSKKKVEHFLKKLSEERAAWRSREHEKVRAVIDDIKVDLSRERKNRQRLEIVNSKLVDELAEVKLSAKRYMQDYEKERKARELIEEVCDELAKEIGEDKAEVDSLKRECVKLREEVDDERKMLQMAEVWREERVQMKLIDAKVALDQKYSQMNCLVSELEKFLRSKAVSLDENEMRDAELFRHAAASINIQDVKEFTYEPSNSDDIFAVVEEMAMAESNEREIEACAEYSSASHASKIRTVSPGFKNHSKDSMHRLSNVYGNQSGNFDDDGSGWETVSHAEDQGSNYSAEGSIMSVNRMCRDSNVSGSCTEWDEQIGDETPITEISEVCSVPSKQSKKVKSISRLWRSGPNNGDNYKIISVDDVKKLSNGRMSNGALMSPDRGSGKGGISPSDMVGWSSPESNPHINRGMKGCIEWPRAAQKSSLKNKLLEARMESQKVQLRQVLKQKI